MDDFSKIIYGTYIVLKSDLFSTLILNQEFSLMMRIQNLAMEVISFFDSINDPDDIKNLSAYRNLSSVIHISDDFIEELFDFVNERFDLDN